MRYLILIAAAVIGMCVYMSCPPNDLTDRRLLKHAAEAFASDADRIQSGDVTREEAIEMLRYHANYFSVQANRPN